MLVYASLSTKYASTVGIAERTFACAAAEFAHSRNPRYDGTAMASQNTNDDDYNKKLDQGETTLTITLAQYAP